MWSAPSLPWPTASFSFRPSPAWSCSATLSLPPSCSSRWLLLSSMGSSKALPDLHTSWGSAAWQQHSCLSSAVPSLSGRAQAGAEHAMRRRSRFQRARNCLAALSRAELCRGGLTWPEAPLQCTSLSAAYGLHHQAKRKQARLTWLCPHQLLVGRPCSPAGPVVPGWLPAPACYPRSA